MHGLSRHIVLIGLFFSILLSACSKSAEKNIVIVQVLKDGSPVENHFVGLGVYNFNNTFDYTYTDKGGIAKLSAKNFVSPEANLSEMVILAPDKTGCGYTEFIGFGELHTINLSTEEIVTVEVLSPDLENLRFADRETISIRMQVHSNFEPFSLKLPLLEAKDGKINGALNGLVLDDLINPDGTFEFDYTVVSGENGFWVSYNRESHNQGERPYDFFEIKLK